MDADKIGWETLLDEALSNPGTVSRAYTAFHDYSIGNQLLALIQCAMRDIKPGPLSTFMGWKDKGRYVKKGQRAISLWMPITGKKHVSKTLDDGREETEEVGYTRFVIRNNWFVLDQTEGQEFTSVPVPGWDEQKALEALEIEKIDFDLMDGNCQGYAQKGRKVAVNPLAAMPHKTLFHELAHVLLGHCDETLTDSEATPKSLREVEAESVAMLCCESLGMAGAEYSRGYIQSWAGISEIPDKSIQQIFKAADQILKAGRLAS